MHFYKLQGFVISDWQGIDKITDPTHSNYTYSVLAGVQAGIDMVSGSGQFDFIFKFSLHKNKLVRLPNVINANCNWKVLVCLFSRL